MSDLSGILRPGSDVTIDGGIPGKILTVLLRELRGQIVVQYECVWWKDGSRTSAYLDSFEFEPTVDGQSVSVGFS